MKVCSLEKLDDDALADIIELFSRIPGTTCSKVDYARYISENFYRIHLSVAYDENGKIVAFTHAEPPHPLDPECGYLPFSYCPVGKDVSRKGLELAERFMALLGAKKWRMETVHSGRKLDALKRMYGLRSDREIILYKDINHD